jgi:hypothetical protein
MITVIAAIIAAAVATFGYVITARAKLLEDRRKTYAEALAAVHAYQELPHRIRRRPNSSQTILDGLGTVISDIQRDLDFYKSLLYLDSPNSGTHITRLPKRHEIKARNSVTRHGRSRPL